MHTGEMQTGGDSKENVENGKEKRILSETL